MAGTKVGARSYRDMKRPREPTTETRKSVIENAAVQSFESLSKRLSRIRSSRMSLAVVRSGGHRRRATLRTSATGVARQVVPAP